VSMRSEHAVAAVAYPDPTAVSGLALHGAASVAVIRTARGWSVVCPAGSQNVDGLVEGLTLADLIGEELGFEPEPDRTARPSARGPAAGETGAEDPRDARIAALERTVAQLEHALAARVLTERAIGVLAEREGVHPRTAFEGLRRSARSSGRPVHELAGEVLASLEGGPLPQATSGAAPDPRAKHVVPAAPSPRPPFQRRVEHARTRVTGDGRS